MQYVVREISEDWENVQLYIPHTDVETCKVYEIVFGRLNGRQNIEISIDIPCTMLDGELDLYFGDGRGNMIKMGYKRNENTIRFYTNKVGFYAIVLNSEKENVVSKIMNNASSITKYMGLRMDKSMRGM